MKRFAKTSRKIAKLVEKKNFQVQYVFTGGDVADIFTKALGQIRFQSLRQVLNVEDVRLQSTSTMSAVGVAEAG
ncbi:hypothetical protein PC129_g15085 [Phytophthora cactorum]|uniref:Uncharacterized protein n=1 Tax=Phytophthora cactorum TaxID=29920 RepID=A0A329REL4_9STRA|nr:hypothetical protein Pcac1_g6113 [Phytophthora cactorum]KAG2808394.1 hypothetical protein PC112_g16990 [Phytophthora cactorum]KAG2809917.1 hypothetical protein PC111_g15867 [Phytophthora cactorum]KAG2850143.1 hypothetical protein PC113_g17053 [Phytophthora cactorum]KAG2887792.1 hypothetical protein PC114_g18677 [Phytophthora cactorum]